MLQNCTKKSILAWFRSHYMNIVAFANSIDPDDTAHNELPDLDSHCLLSTVVF